MTLYVPGSLYTFTLSIYGVSEWSAIIDDPGDLDCLYKLPDHSVK